MKPAAAHFLPLAKYFTWYQSFCSFFSFLFCIEYLSGAGEGDCCVSLLNSCRFGGFVKCNIAVFFLINNEGLDSVCA